MTTDCLESLATLLMVLAAFSTFQYTANKQMYNYDYIFLAFIHFNSFKIHSLSQSSSLSHGSWNLSLCNVSLLIKV